MEALDLSADNSSVGMSSIRMLDIYSALQAYAQSIKKLRFGVARECIEIFRIKYVRCSTDSEISSYNLFLNIANQLSVLERTYFTLNFLLPKAFFRRDSTILSSYGAIRDEIQQYVDSDKSSHEMDSKEVAVRFLQIVCGRISLVNMYGAFSVQCLSTPSEAALLIEHLSSIRITFPNVQKEECLFPFIDNIVSEIDIMQLLLETQKALLNCEFLSSLYHLKALNSQLCQWFTSIDYTKSRSKSSFFSNFSITSIRSTSSLHLCDWLEKFYFLLLSKFSLYFHDILSTHSKQAEMELATCALKEPNFLLNFNNFCRKSTPLFISLIYFRGSWCNDDCADDYTECGEDAQSGELRRTFTVLLSIGSGQNVYGAVLPAISILIQECAQLKVETDRVHYSFDQHLCRSIFVTLIEHSIYLAIVFDKRVSERDCTVMNFIVENSSALRCGKLCQLLRGASKL